MRSKRLAVFLSALFAAQPLAAAPRLKYVVIVSRHGVRSPTWDAARLNEYSAEPWPEWGVAPGEITPHGRKLIQLMGGYYREWLAKERLLETSGCGGAARVRIVADTSQRTLETGRAFSESLAPGCAIPVESQPPGQKDPLFSGAGAADPDRSLDALRARLGPDPRKLIADHRTAIDLLQSILTGGRSAPRMLTGSLEMGVEKADKSVELNGPFAAGSTLSENLLLEYANGFQGASLGWGRLTREKLLKVLEVHAVYADLMRRTPYLAQAHSSNLMEHVLLSMQQAAAGAAVAGALGKPSDTALILAGHDTNLSNLSGMLGLAWNRPGYQPDDTPPGGALVFSLWRSDAGDSVTLRYVAQSPDQMRNAERLSLAKPPESQNVSIPGCQRAPETSGCTWDSFQTILRKALDPAFPGVPARQTP